MDQNEDPRELELKIEQAERIAARIGDPTTLERLKAWADELRGRPRRRLDARRTKEAISIRLDNGTERGRHRLYGNRCRVCGVATETLRSDRLHDAKEAREETVVFEDAQTIS